RRSSSSARLSSLPAPAGDLEILEVIGISDREREHGLTVNQHAAVNVDHCSCDVGGEIRSEEQKCAADIARTAVTTQLGAFEDLRTHILGQLAARNVRLDQAGGED